MAGDREGSDGVLPMELLGRGDPSFVDALRAVDDAEALADFAAPWHDDRRPEARRLLFDYLDRPLNAYRHEGLVKRLFKRAEAAGDDEAMARFLVLFDRSVRRIRKVRHRPMHEVVATPEEARRLMDLWSGLGISVSSWSSLQGFHLWGRRPDEVIAFPRGSAMPRGRMIAGPRKNPRTGEPIDEPRPDWAHRFRLDWPGEGRPDLRELPFLLQKMQRLRLFSLATRGYLRRRSWRYFRKLGKVDPSRYIAATCEALALYRDEDVADGLALIDNWGLAHILFHHSPALVAQPDGWTVAPGRSLSGLAPAPSFEAAWAGAPGALVGLLARARSATVRRWAIRRVEADPARSLASGPLEGWVALLGHDDPEVVALASRLLGPAEGLDAIEPGRWLAVAEGASPLALEVVCELVARHVRPDQVSLEQAVRLAGSRPLPLARLGFGWLRARAPRAGEADRLLLGLLDAGSGPLRPDLLGWLRQVLGDVPGAPLEFLDSRHADARAVGWAWFLADPRTADDPDLWRRLLESPHDDVRLALVAELESRVAAGSGRVAVAKTLDLDLLRGLWAAVLLNVHRGSRARPAVVRQLLGRLEARPAEAPALLPLLGVALRSVRGPERRAGLVAVVRLVERRAEVGPLVRSAFPELQWP